MILLPVISFLGFCLTLSLAAGWAIEAMPLLTAAGLIAALYLAALAGALAAGAKALLWTGLALFAGSAAFILYRRRVDFFSRVLTPGLALFAAAAAAAWLRMNGELFLEWDAFSHWGLVIKDMVLSGALPSVDSAVAFKDYPPGATLFQYFMAAPSGFSEGNAFFAHSFLLLSAAAAFTIGFPWKKLLTAAGAFLLACLLLPVFGFPFRTVMVDSLIGLFAGAALAGYFLSEGSRRAAALRTAPVLFVLPLFKPAGALLAITAGAAIAADVIYRPWRLEAPAAAVRGPAAVLSVLFVSTLLLLAPAVSSKSWTHRVEARGLAITISSKIPASKVLASFSNSATARDKAIIAAFARGLFRMRLGKPAVPPLAWVMLLLAGAAFIFSRSRPPERFQIASLQAAMLAGFSAYCIGLLVLYLHGFSEYEGMKLASFSRYMGLFLLAWGASLAALAVRWARGTEGKWNVRPFYASVPVALVLAGWAFVPFENKNLPIRKAVAQALAPAKEVLKPGDKVYLIWQNTTGYEYWMSRYELAPAHSSMDPFSIGRKYSEQDAWTETLSVQDWSALLARNDYLVIGRADDAFWAKYGRLFAGEPRGCAGGLFKILGAKDSVTLECMSKGSGS